MLEVKIENILPITEIKNNFDSLIEKVRNSDELLVGAIDGKPDFVLVGVHHLEKLTGTSHEEIMPESAAAATPQNDSIAPRDQVLDKSNSLPTEDETPIDLQKESLNLAREAGSIPEDIWNATAEPNDNHGDETPEIEKASEETLNNIGQFASSSTQAAAVEPQTEPQIDSTSVNPQFTYSTIPATDNSPASNFANNTDSGVLPTTSSMPQESNDELTMNVMPENPSMPPQANSFDQNQTFQTPTFGQPSAQENTPDANPAPQFQAPIQNQQDNNLAINSTADDNQAQSSQNNQAGPVIYQ